MGRDANFSRRSFLTCAMMAGSAALLSNPVFGADSDTASLPRLKGNRFLTFNTVVRVNQIEVSRDRKAGEDEGTLHTLASVRQLRECFGRGFPGGRITWAFSWLALLDQRPNYQAIRKQVLEYHYGYGDEITLAKREGAKVLKVIHGYASSGKGGALYVGLRKSFGLRKKEAVIKDFIAGEDFSIFNDTVWTYWKRCRNCTVTRIWARPTRASPSSG
jgi:hypothetical protein